MNIARALVLTVAPAVLAQGTEGPAQRFAEVRAQLVQQVEAQLRSDDLATVAWGAYTAAEFRLDGCIADLRKKLAALTAGDTSPLRCARTALLDALIQTNAGVPGEELAPFLDCGVPALVLLGRSSDANRELLRRAFRPHAGMSTWQRACGNLLANLRDAEFVRDLVSGPLEVWVWVADPGRQERAEIPVGGGSVACSGFPVPAGFPPIARHRLTTAGEAGAVLVAQGAQSVFVHRSWYHGGLHCEWSESYGEYHSARVAWLEQVLGAEQRLLIEGIDEPVAIEWNGPDALLAFVQERRRQVELRWRALVAACVQAKLPTVDWDAERPPRVQFELLDCRAEQSVPLPDVNARAPK
ncbi:MAG: hypothetical protein ABIP94_12510 [Planctomycetota bacterium]